MPASHSDCDSPDPSERDEARLHLAVRNAPLPIMIHAEDGEVIQISQAWEDITGYSIEAIPTTADWTEAAYGTRAENVREDIERLYGLTGRVDEGEYTVRTADGSSRIWDFSSAPLGRLLDGRRLVMSTARDVTGRKAAESALEESRALLQAVIDGTSDAVYVKDRSGRYLLFNHAAERVTGKRSEEVLGQDDTFLFPREEAEAVMAGDRAVLDGGVATTYEERVTAADGTVRDFSSTKGPLFDPDGQTTGLFGIARDVTERRHILESLAASEDRFRYFFDHSVVAQSITRPTGEIHVNEAFCEMLGYTQAELSEGTTWVQISHPADVADTQRHVASLLAGERSEAHFRKRYVHKDGSAVLADVRTSLRRDPLGEPMYFMTTIVDITDRERVDAELLGRTNELARSNAELARFAHVASHDLQEPLRAVASYVQLLQHRYGGRLDADADEFIGYAVDGVKRMQILIDGLLAYSKIGTDGAPSTQADLEQVLVDVLRGLEPSTVEAGATVTHDAMPTVTCDPIQIGRVFQNLIGNAVKYRGSEPPIIHVSAAAAEGEWTFSVADNGIGVEPGSFDRIFLIFERLHSRTERPGTGMGLAICKRIVEQHGGHIRVESEPGVGSTFLFTLPAG